VAFFVAVATREVKPHDNRNVPAKDAQPLALKVDGERHAGVSGSPVAKRPPNPLNSTISKQISATRLRTP
jgi:hypothetical protein